MARIADIDRENRTGLTIAVRYEPQRHKTWLTIRCNGKIIEKLGLDGDVDEKRIQNIIRGIKQSHGRDCSE